MKKELTINDLASGIQTVINRLDGVDERLAGMDMRFDAMDERFNVLETKVDGIALDLDNLALCTKEGFDDLGSKVDANTKAITELDTKMFKVQDILFDHGTRIRRMEKTLH